MPLGSDCYEWLDVTEIENDADYWFNRAQDIDAELRARLREQRDSFVRRTAHLEAYNRSLLERIVEVTLMMSPPPILYPRKGDL